MPLGILAGRSGLPIEVAAEVVGRGDRVHIVGIRGETDPDIERFDHTWVRWGEIGALLKAFRKAGCRELVIIGGVRRPDLRAVRADLGLLGNLPLILSLMRGGDDSVLRRVVSFFQRNGFVVLGAHEVAPALLAGSGVLSLQEPPEADLADIKTGLGLIRAFGPADVGQAVVVAGGRMLAIEAAEGTDAILRRVAAQRESGGAGGVLVKAPKPGQELRVDLPTIGPRTVELAAMARLSTIAVAAGQVLVAERDRISQLLTDHGLALFGAQGQAVLPDQAGSAESPGADLHPIGRISLSQAQASDARRALLVMREGRAYDTADTVVVARRHVIAVDAGEGPGAVIERSTGLRQWGDRGSRRRRGVLATRATALPPEKLVDAAAEAGLAGLVLANGAWGPAERIAVAEAADRRGLFTLAEARQSELEAGRPLSVFLVAGEHSGDALGAKLMAAMRARLGRNVRFAGVGGELMEAQGFSSLFPLADVAVMGPLSILPRLPRIVARVHRTVDAAIAADPDLVIIIDSPEFSHPIAKRIRKRRPSVPIIDYVCPQVWAWRSGRAPKMRPYIDHILALLPFEPEALQRLGGPACTYVGHPLIERLDALRAAEAGPLADRLGLDPARPVLVVLPGSRSSEVGRLMHPFGAAVAALQAHGYEPEVIIPTLPHVRPQVQAALASWPVRPHLVEDEQDKFRAFRMARAALAASGTVTLELALAGTPTVVAYRVDPLASLLRFLVKVPTIVLANLVLGENVFPEFIQEDCAPAKLAAALAPLLGDSPERARQLSGLARIASKMRLPAGTPSEKAADVVLGYAPAPR